MRRVRLSSDPVSTAAMPPRPPLRAGALCALLLALAACAATEETTSGGGPVVQQGAAGGRLALARTDDRVKTVQLYRTGDETSLPVISLGSGETLTLEFDLVGEGTGRPLSVYFYHADRQWRRDLTPSEFLTAFLSDDVRQYEISSATQVDYVHYTYEFPGPNIGFTVSGNFVVRVSEQGREGEVLLERAFFVSEDVAEVEMGFQTGFSGGATVVQPVVRLQPGPRLSDAQPFDYAVCFARNGRFEQTRCAQDPSLLGLALYQFYLPHDQAFEAERPLYEVDLGPLQIGPQVARIDYGTEPYTAVLDLDYARFGGEVTRASLTGQPVVETAYRGGGRPETAAEYVDVAFRYVPEGEREASGPVLLTGAFNGWQLDPARALTWNAAEKFYEGSLRLKQGLYLYQYVVDDPTQRREARLSQPSLYTAFVYLTDTRRLTDRLVAVQSAVGQ
jgi:hypothetical protein